MTQQDSTHLHRCGEAPFVHSIDSTSASTKTTMEYIILRGISTALESEVRKYIAHGWCPQGGISQAGIDNQIKKATGSDCPQFAQAMVKEFTL